ncbi:Glutathione S-transferase domain protein [Methylocella silvestris BL2]|uniref:Glutathione S-transferase domain protein n=1 Tax=Methylocella silvestris (strain DSM 15510 / CIP 108128 / LMG 27833 / NCIMB 13906 / BL2) TaxID=395965 RepID=B8EKE6_METSB|nr:glutathione S-transferase N-terminal domain-containing protein [Methylocella silvestris]ACK50686.1 Glutathione S-transferase domain protein [Methylocella silvestris BL2]
MKFYMTPGSCSTGIHILLEEVGLVFEAYIVNLVKGDHLKPDYLAINPNGTIPTLVCDDGGTLTDFNSIAVWLAKTYPRRRLMPQDEQAAQFALETLNFCTRHIHGEGFRRVFTPENYVSARKGVEAIKSEGRDIVLKALETVNGELSGKAYVAGDFSIADAALFYVEFWADKTNIPLPDNCLAHYKLMRSRPAVRQVLAEEGYR